MPLTEAQVKGRVDLKVAAMLKMTQRCSRFTTHKNPVHKQNWWYFLLSFGSSLFWQIKSTLKKVNFIIPLPDTLARLFEHLHQVRNGVLGLCSTETVTWNRCQSSNRQQELDDYIYPAQTNPLNLAKTYLWLQLYTLQKHMQERSVARVRQPTQCLNVYL